MTNSRTLVALSCALVASSFALDSAEAKNKKQHRYVGQHPLSVNADDGYCYIELPHVHAAAPPAKHKALYRDHRGDNYFIADPQPYGYDGDKHAYYGHHPVAVEVVLGAESQYESGQELEYCYLDGPHHHAFDVQPGLTFEVKGGVQWYIGALPAAYVQDKTLYAPGNNVYATVEVQRPVVEVDVPPVGYLGPILEVHLHGNHDDHGHGRGHGDAHVSGHVGIGIQVEVPTVQIGLGLPGVVIVDDHGHGHGHDHVYKKQKGHKGFKKHKGRHR